METTKTEGVMHEAVGRATEAAGDMLGDAGTTLRGNAKVLCGKSMQMVGDAADVARDALADKPLAVLGAALGVGFVIGALWAGNRH
ncbi:MAG TPA: CsbD family protein [Paraburkholderia sp.]|jgi:uncharacterized protein YjbJ (UPF0337 family)|nr:CsbD family protein [Paraburkholderia sp.]